MMALFRHMKRYNLIAVGIAFVLFIVPFFWLTPGFADLGGDAGRLYFLDPLTVAKNTYLRTDQSAAASFAIIPYELFVTVLKTFVQSPTNLISFERGVQLGLAFFSLYLIAIELGANGWAAIAAGVVYVGLITKIGWVLSLETHNQVFLNPLIFYFLLKLILTRRFGYGLLILILTVLYSGNFGFSATPAVAAFYPLSILFLLFVTKYIMRKSIPWRHISVLMVLFIIFHSFHLLPTLSFVFTKNTQANSYIFSRSSIDYSGVHYFESNHRELGKISTELFQPSAWNKNVLLLLIPCVLVLGFLKRPGKLMAITGAFFTITLFLTSANITQIGTSFYRTLFYIPGFMMFRSFNEKWYFVHAFFYALLFGLSFHSIFKSQSGRIVRWASLFVIGVVGFLIFPFLQGKAIDVPYYQSANVSPIFKMDLDLTDSLRFVKALPSGKVLTLPLTFPYYQIAYGTEGGAYVGISMVRYLAGREDYPGFWSFGEYAQPMFDALHDRNTDKILSILGRLDVQYVFYNSDARIMDNFPGYPYVYPGMMYSSKDQLPAIRDKSAYKAFLAKWPLTKIYEKGFYTIYEINY